MFSVHYMYMISVHIMMSLREYMKHMCWSGSSTRALYISLPTVIVNGTKNFAGALVSPEKLRRLKLV